MLDTSARLLRLLSLLQARRFWSGADLAERLSVTERTVRRDIDRLRSLGYPVDAASGAAGGYQLGAGAVLPPLLLDDDEALAVSIGLGTAASTAITGIGDAALRALVKLENVLPSRLRRRMNTLRAFITPLERMGPAIDASTLAILAGACRDHEQLVFRYDDARGSSSERLVEPQGLVPTGNRWYLVAWDVNRSDWRTFRVDRISSKISAGSRFVPRPAPEGDLRSYVSRSLSSDVYAHKAKVLLEAPFEVMSKRVPSRAGTLERVDDQHCLFQTGGHSLESMAVWMLMLGVDFTVKEPPELATHLKALHERLGRSLASHEGARTKPRQKAKRRART